MGSVADERPRPAFRPDIEGLRGLAILLVVAFHAGLPAFRGGFVGVDVFFVLSGFFVTTLLARELDETGEIDAQAFYTRRAMRLLPAMYLVLLATLALVFTLYAPIDRASIADVARWVSLHAGNVAFARGAVDYFYSGENPLLHTWSLGVEEQFYVAWPLLLIIVGLFGLAADGGVPDASQRERLRRRLLWTIVIAGVASLGASVLLTRIHQPWAFFGLPARIWEFGLGGLLALFLDDRRTPEGRSSAMQAVGIVMITVAVLSYDRSTAYPGVAAILPAGATALLIVGGSQAPGSVVSRALSTNGLRWLGRVSYAWYLWHWPLMGVGAAINPSIGPGGRLAWAGLALVLAWMTHRFLEQPVRHGGTVLERVPPAWLLPGALAASVAVAAVSHAAMRVAERRASLPDQRPFALARIDRMEHDCWASTAADVGRPCDFGDKSASTRLALLGDSHAEHWLGALDRFGREVGVRITAMVKGGCPVPEMPELLQPRLKRYYHECTRFREAAVRRIIEMRPQAVILSSWDHYFPVNGAASDWQVTPATWQRGLRRTYERLSNAGLRVIVIRGTPRTWFDVPACLSRRAAQLPGAGSFTYARATSLSPLAIDAQDNAARGLNVTFIDMNDQICASSSCGVEKNGTVVFTDDNHLTASFSRSVGLVLGARIAAAIRD
jgi:peptidoglycan/LPS O-acetylase OafA/YrhL